MKNLGIKSSLIATLIMASAAANAAPATIFISEVDSGGSSTSYGADWFELTNNTASAININGWKMDDNSDSFSSAVALRGLTSIAAGKSVIFIEGASTSAGDSTLNAAFLAAWFGTNIPANITLGNYGGSSVTLSSSGDHVNIFNSTGTKITNVIFGVLPTGKTFNNAAGLTGAISTLSALGVNAGITSFSTSEIGSPFAVPEPESYVLLMAGLVLIGAISRKRQA